VTVISDAPASQPGAKDNDTSVGVNVHQLPVLLPVIFDVRQSQIQVFESFYLKSKTKLNLTIMRGKPVCLSVSPI